MPPEKKKSPVRDALLRTAGVTPLAEPRTYPIAASGRDIARQDFTAGAKAHADSAKIASGMRAERRQMNYDIANEITPYNGYGPMSWSEWDKQNPKPSPTPEDRRRQANDTADAIRRKTRAPSDATRVR